jgi:hypothetical protein
VREEGHASFSHGGGSVFESGLRLEVVIQPQEERMKPDRQHFVVGGLGLPTFVDDALEADYETGAVLTVRTVDVDGVFRPSDFR